MPTSASAEPKLTVIVSPREGHFAAVESLKSVIADDAEPFKLIYIDILSPPPTAAAIRAICAQHGFPIVRHDAWIAPSAARKAILETITTPYVIFVDNDVMPQPGCFARLVACAEETGAGVVGPLYLYGPPEDSRIHMAGGGLDRDADGRLIAERHRLITEPAGAADGLARQPIDFVECHCLLIRTALAREPEVISDDVLLVHEHIDLALKARERGAEVWLEPAARLNMVILSPPRLGDFDYFRRRWDEAAIEADLAAFARRWPVDPEPFFAGLRLFRHERATSASPFHPGARRGGLEQAMKAAELAQTRTALREQAQARGYEPAAVRNLETACDFATLLCDGLYRADGRPFLNHVIGTASALIRYDLRNDVVLAALQHAAYTHRPPWADAAEIARFLASGGEVDTIVRALPRAKAQLATGAVVEALSLTEAWALAIEAANEVDMLLSGEYRASGRPAEVTAGGHALLGEVLGRLGVPGLAKTAAGPRGEGVQGPLLGRAALHESFRLDARNRRMAPGVWRG